MKPQPVPFAPRPLDLFPGALGRACPAPTPCLCRGEACLARAPLGGGAERLKEFAAIARHYQCTLSVRSGAGHSAEELEAIEVNQSAFDHKTALQELLQELAKETPTYRTVGTPVRTLRPALVSLPSQRTAVLSPAELSLAA